MRVRKKDGSQERKLLIAFITDKHFLSRIDPKWKIEGLFASRFANTIAGWCISYFRKYREAPNEKIEDKFEQWQQGKDDAMLEVINSSLSLISSAGSAIPLYGTLASTVSSGITALITSIGKREKDLSDKTPAMLKLLNVTSQFENQKSIIDHEWAQINKELEQLQKENTSLLEDQMSYYGISMQDYKRKYLTATLDIDRETFKNSSRKIIYDKLATLDKSQETRGKWFGQVETYMFKVQSLRLRFGQLTSRMLVNMEQYENLITVYSDSSKFPTEFTTQINGLNNSLKTLKSKFYASYNPAKYIEDSAVMYIERQ
jgi:hypothetical protein